MCWALQVQDSDFVQYFSGNKLLPGSQTAAHCYAGHQFGHFSGQLGDGAAMYLGEVSYVLPGQMHSMRIEMYSVPRNALLYVLS